MPGADVNMSVNVARAAGLTLPDALAAQARFGRYAEAVVHGKAGSGSRHNLADEGSYWRAGSFQYEVGNRTRYTSLARSAWSANGDYAIFNTDPAGGRRIYLDFFRVLSSATTAFTGAPTAQFSCSIDAGPSAIPTPTQGNTTASNLTPADMQETGDFKQAYPGLFLGPQAFGQVGYVATGTTRVVARAVLRPTGSVGLGGDDEWLVVFGGKQQGGCVDTSNGTAPMRTLTAVPPVVVGPGCAAFFSLWFPGGSGGGANTLGEFELGFWAR